MSTREGDYRGVRFQVEATEIGPQAWQGRYRLLDGDGRSGDSDEVHPSVDRVWSTENEALSYASEAAGHAIEAAEFGRPQAQGHGSGSTLRRTDNLGQ